MNNNILLHYTFTVYSKYLVYNNLVVIEILDKTEQSTQHTEQGLI